MTWVILFASLLITIILHEFGHLIVARLCKVKVEVFCVGFFKPYLHKTWKGIDWRITPWLIGGYCKLRGETNKVKNGFLVQSYRKKVFIAMAGVTVNLIVALICYLLNYRNIFIGLKCFTNDYTYIVKYYLQYRPNTFLWQLSMINIFCFAVNLIPFPSLDGSYLWLPLMEKVWKKNYIKYLNRLCICGFIILNITQVILIIWMFTRKG
jgi:membrane-associated protease RseP (regulator of RpoE activity)